MDSVDDLTGGEKEGDKVDNGKEEEIKRNGAGAC